MKVIHNKTKKIVHIIFTSKHVDLSSHNYFRYIAHPEVVLVFENTQQKTLLGIEIRDDELINLRHLKNLSFNDVALVD